MKHRLLFWALTFSWALPSFAQTIETDRPDQTEAATLVPVGGIQLEAGVAGWTSGDATVTGYTLPTALLRYGLHERFELRVVGQRDQMQFNFIDLEEPWMTTSAWDLGAKVAGWNTDASQMCLLPTTDFAPVQTTEDRFASTWRNLLALVSASAPTLAWRGSGPKKMRRPLEKQSTP
jgi:hypothetical protein